jgi:hypothetical protein
MTDKEIRELLIDYAMDGLPKGTADFYRKQVEINVDKFLKRRKKSSEVFVEEDDGYSELKE